MTECGDRHSSQRWLTSDSSGHRKGWCLGEGPPVLEGAEKFSLLHGKTRSTKVSCQLPAFPVPQDDIEIEGAR